MVWKREAAFWLAVLLAFVCRTAYGDAVSQETAEQMMNADARVERALLIGIDDFVSQPSAYPSSTNNAYAIQEMFQSAIKPLKSLLLPDKPVTSAEELTLLIQHAFKNAKPSDVNYLYISTHGLYDPANGVEPALLLSDGVTEGSISPQELEAAFDGLQGTNVIILDACNSGAFIGKGMAVQPHEVAFSGDRFKVLTSSGAMEESWYWSTSDQAENGGGKQGAFYFTQALCDALSPASGYPADQNHDGSVTLRELYDYLLLNHAASAPQVYPQTDSFVIFSYDTEEILPAGSERSPIMDVTFSGTILDRTNRELTIEFIAMRPVRVAYQMVYRSEGRWEFENAQLIYDEAERFTTFGDQEGAISAGRKVRSLMLDELPSDAYGYVMLQLVSIENGKLRVHAGRVLCVLPTTDEQTLSVQIQDIFDLASGKEMAIFIGHDYPCALSVSIVDEEGKTVHRLCHRASTRPMGLVPDGSVLYWDGRLKNGEPVPPGSYRVRAQATLNSETVTVESEWFEVQ
ncbi:MAG: caspase family protein [Eubacteriales bacterium]|nr:caspase family protein [Eubacteriales bacterium]